ncbi:MAG TPA: hypothetical protein VF824_18835 [Thermoanaerobaculia bacterium]|jgi:hypothetical protein
MADEKNSIETAISRARDGVGEHIDELDRHLRTNYDPGTLARNYAPQIIGAGAVVGLLVGFGLPKVLRRAVTWGVPLGILAMTIKNARDSSDQPDLEGLA